MNTERTLNEITETVERLDDRRAGYVAAFILGAAAGEGKDQRGEAMAALRTLDARKIELVGAFARGVASGAAQGAQTAGR